MPVSVTAQTGIAAFWLKGTSSGINDGLELFDADGKPTQTMLSIISWKVGLETGRYKPNQLVLARIIHPEQADVA